MGVSGGGRRPQPDPVSGAMPDLPSDLFGVKRLSRISPWTAGPAIRPSPSAAWLTRPDFAASEPTGCPTARNLARGAEQLSARCRGGRPGGRYRSGRRRPGWTVVAAAEGDWFQVVDGDRGTRLELLAAVMAPPAVLLEHVQPDRLVDAGPVGRTPAHAFGHDPQSALAPNLVAWPPLLAAGPTTTSGLRSLPTGRKAGRPSRRCGARAAASRSPRRTCPERSAGPNCSSALTASTCSVG